MKTVNIKVTVADDEFYDWFIEPHKINGELPNLVIRLLTAYANNSELAYQIDQFLDKDAEPEAFEMREAILQAITQLNSLEATANQELEALSDTDTAPEEDEDDIIITSPTGEDVYTPESVAKNIGSMIGLTDNTPEEPIPEPQMPYEQPSMTAPVARNDEFEGKIFSALDTLTSQISNLTSAVTQMVAINSQPMMIPMQMGMMPMQTGGVPMQMSTQAPQMGITVPQANVPLTTPQNSPVSTPETPSAVTSENVMPSNNAQNGSNTGVLSADSETTPPAPESPVKRNSDAPTAIVEKSVEKVENVEDISAESAEGEDDSYSVPDFMSDMIDSCL